VEELAKNPPIFLPYLTGERAPIFDENARGVFFGISDKTDILKELAEVLGAEICASRGLVDTGKLPYESQVGLTGKTISPPVYIAIGISGAVHHIAGMQKSATVIAVNPDKDATIFEYADYGVTDNF
jgi:electron transfer flavoprotein alpha subunit